MLRASAAGLVSLLLAGGAAGCGPLDRHVPAEDDRAGRAYIEALRAGRPARCGP
ncbi:MAG TPA: hypothetical protein VNA89_13130 [Gemmatimonadaceae bacterium]|nr:hypothetical protein [Gemmatimonadaceae bacterium]